MREEDRLAYMERIKCQVPTQMNGEILDRLIRSHLEQIPFENLDVIDFGRVPELGEDILFEKIVRKKRGGYCFELNILFRRLLESLGLFVYPVAARVLWNRDYLPPVSHMGLVADIAGRKGFCDVGYGGPGPKGLLWLEEGEQSVAGEWFRVERDVNGDFFIQRLQGKEWKRVLCFRDAPVEETDFQVLNFYCARNEKIIFTQKRIVNLCTPSGSKALTDMELTVREAEKVYQTVYRDKGELEQGLRQEFGICVAFD